jgi:hypothetical protein
MCSRNTMLYTDIGLMLQQKYYPVYRRQTDVQQTYYTIYITPDMKYYTSVLWISDVIRLDSGYQSVCLDHDGSAREAFALLCNIMRRVLVVADRSLVIWLPFWRSRNHSSWISWLLKMTLVCCPETSVSRTCQPTLTSQKSERWTTSRREPDVSHSLAVAVRL